MSGWQFKVNSMRLLVAAQKSHYPKKPKSQRWPNP
jgi:hypothetical protein